MTDKDQRIVELQATVDNDTELFAGLNSTLAQIANALKGDPAPHTMHDWSDLPEVATELKAEHDRMRKVLHALRFAIGAAVHDETLVRIVSESAETRRRLRDALVIGHEMMGSMKGHDFPAHKDLWCQFEIALADLCNDGLLDKPAGEGA